MYLRKYETVAIVDPDAGNDGVEKVVGRMRDAVGKTGGKEIRYEDWGRRRLAFELNRRKKGHYLYLLYFGTSTTVAEVERMLKITEESIKFQTVLLETMVRAEQFDFTKAADERTEISRFARFEDDPEEVAPVYGSIEPAAVIDDDDDDDDAEEDEA